VLGGKVFAYLPATHHIQTRCVSYRKKPAAQTAHLVFADTKANAEKPKELFFANARMKLIRKN
jgi:hypothetical protein